MSRAIFEPMVWGDVTLRAKFLVEPAAEGVLAGGFIVRAEDAATYSSSRLSNQLASDPLEVG